MADTKITFTIPEAKVQRVIDAMKGLYAIPLNENGTPLFTDGQWAKEAVRRWIINSVYSYEDSEAKKAAIVVSDDEIIL